MQEQRYTDLQEHKYRNRDTEANIKHYIYTGTEIQEHRYRSKDTGTKIQE